MLLKLLYHTPTTSNFLQVEIKYPTLVGLLFPIDLCSDVHLSFWRSLFSFFFVPCFSFNHQWFYPVLFLYPLPPRTSLLMGNQSAFLRCQRWRQLKRRLCTLLRSSTPIYLYRFRFWERPLPAGKLERSLYIAPARVWCKTVCKENQLVGILRKNDETYRIQKAWQYSTHSSCFSYTTQ